MKLEFTEIEEPRLFPMFVAVITDDTNQKAFYEVDALMRKALEDAFKAGQDKERREQQVHIKTEEEAEELAQFFSKESLCRKAGYTFKPYKMRDGDWRLYLMRGEHAIQDYLALHKSQRHTVMLLCDAIDKQYLNGVAQGRLSMMADGIKAVCAATNMSPTLLKDTLDGHPSFNR